MLWSEEFTRQNAVQKKRLELAQRYAYSMERIHAMSEDAHKHALSANMQELEERVEKIAALEQELKKFAFFRI